MWRLRPTVLLAAAWALTCLVIVRRRLRREGVRATCPAAPRLPMKAYPGVSAVISRLSPTCIERALIIQSWLTAHERYHDIVVGIPTGGMSTETAHAWVDGFEPESAVKYTEIHRIQPARRPAAPQA
ncbi:lasso peptide biosynthesis protein [Jatrophihabitans telluris]|uniref:Lasso peptide biosynthesis protein n=1 Tax=Jatrophihabitans telluris TaxID=2038343 RepID=A0ABY4QW26_9ACTN|nr:lasso peptide biosynthesis protein [Jatrophihabitans telluris]UQX87873.1 lasso peptide biosynthesis protein [Jatrophihabitans telluris]